MSKNIVITPGDGIGKEVTVQARKVMEYMAKRFQIVLEFTEVPIGGTAYDLTGTPLPDETLQACKAADAILLGAVGGPEWEALDYSVRPERALLGLRGELQHYANLRPAQIYGELVGASTLKPEVVDGADIMVIRELTGEFTLANPKELRSETESALASILWCILSLRFVELPRWVLKLLRNVVVV